MKPNTFSVIVRIWNDEEEPYYEKNDKQYSFDSLLSAKSMIKPKKNPNNSNGIPFIL